MTAFPEDWRTWARTYAWLPRALRLPGAALPRWWLPLRNPAFNLIFESARAGRYTVWIGHVAQFLIQPAEGPARAFRVAPDQQTLTPEPSPDAPSVALLRDWLARNRGPRLKGYPPIQGGLFGALAYDVARSIEKLPALAQDDLHLPLHAFVLADELAVFNHETRELCLFAWTPSPTEPTDAALQAAWDAAEARLTRLSERWNAACAASAEALATTPHAAPEAGCAPPPTFDRTTFCTAVERVQDYIRAGHTYQVNLSLRESRPLHAPAAWVYECLRRINPSPYMGLVEFPGLTLVSGSPELLVRLQGDTLEARPIAGTRPRGAKDPADAELAAELLAHPKERAEHLMLVDLIRNDLGRVSSPGSVHVPEFMVLERYSHVMHIVSHVVGKLAPDRDALDALASAFPGGTITGAPKVRTMEIIEELEPVRRSFYTGSLGWLGFSGDMEWNIAIRTMIVSEGVAHVQAGAGIVADSVPTREYEESLNKARALWAAHQRAKDLWKTRTPPD